MRQKDFIYWLLNEQGEPLTSDPRTGLIQPGSKDTLLGPDGRPAFLKKSPDGWRDVLIKYGRNNRYWGLFRDFTVPMKFPYDGGLILKDAFWRKGIEGFLKLLIHKSDRSIWPENYKTYYFGEIDLSKFKQDKYSIPTVNVMEGGPSKYLKSNENKVYEIPIDTDPEHKDLVLDGVVLFEKANFLVADGVEILKSIWGVFFYLPTIFINSEGLPGFFFQSQNIQDVSSLSWNDRLALLNYCAVADADNTSPIDLVIKGTLKFKCTANDPGLAFRMRFIRSNLDISDQNLYQIFDEIVVVDQVYVVNVDLTIPMDPDERLYFEGGYSNFPSVEVAIVFEEGSSLDFDYRYRYRPTKCKGLYPMRLFQKLVEKMTDGKYTAKSDWLSAKQDILINSGDAIRGIITQYDDQGAVISAGAVIKTSMADFFKAMSRWGVGLGIENDQIVIERLPYFFQTGVSIELGQVDDCEFSVADDLIFNRIKAGYKTQEYNDVNGKYEFNQGQEYSTPVTRISRDLDIVSSYRADPYGIEFIRRNLDGKKTTDDSSDNDTFMINVKEGQYTFSALASFIAASSAMVAPYNVSLEPGDIIQITGSPAGNNGTAVVTGVGYFISFTLVGLSGITLVDEASVVVQIQVLTAASLRLNRPAYDAIEGVPDPSTIFNTELSPKHSVIENYPLIKSSHYQQDDREIIFDSADKNAELKTELAGIIIDEDSNVELSQMPDRLFFPLYATFTTALNVNVTEMLKSNPYNELSFTWKGIVWKAYLWDGGVKPATMDRQQWKVLLSKNNDLTKLINV